MKFVKICQVDIVKLSLSTKEMVIVNLLSRSPRSTASDFCKIGLEEEEEEASIGLEAEEVVEEVVE